jgi:hypothetical protein
MSGMPVCQVQVDQRQSSAIQQKTTDEQETNKRNSHTPSMLACAQSSNDCLRLHNVSVIASRPSQRTLLLLVLHHREDEIPPDSHAVDEENLELQRHDGEVEDLCCRPDLPVFDQRRPQAGAKFLHSLVPEGAEGRDLLSIKAWQLAEEKVDAHGPALDKGQHDCTKGEGASGMSCRLQRGV